MAGTVVETLIIKIAGDAKKFKQELNSLKKANKQGEESFRKLALVGKAGFLAVAAAATAFSVASTKAFISFEKGLISVAKTTNLAGRDLEIFKQEIMDLSEEIPATTTQLLEIATAAGQLGIQGTENLSKFTEVIAKLGATTDLEGGEAAISIARILNLTGEATDTVDQFGSAIVDLGNNFATSESEILAVAKEVAKATVQFKLSSPEILGMSTAMSALGIQAEAGATVVGKAFLKIGAVIRKQAGPQFEKLTELTGMTGDQLTKTFKTDASAVFESFIQGLGKAGESGKSMVEELGKLGLTGIRVNKILPTLASRSDIYSAALKRSIIATRDNTALNKEAATAFGTTASQLTIAGNKVNNLAIGLGEKLAPALIKVVDGMINFLGLNTTAAEEIVESTDSIETLSAAFDEFGEAMKELVKEVKKELETLDRAAKNSLEQQKKVSDKLTKEQEEAAAKREEIAKAEAEKRQQIEKDKLAFIKSSNLEFKKLMDELVSIEKKAAEDADRIAKASAENRAFAMRQAVESITKDLTGLTITLNAFNEKSLIGKGPPGTGAGGPGDFNLKALLSAERRAKGRAAKGSKELEESVKDSGAGGVALGAAERIAGQVTGVSGAISGFQQGGPMGAAIGFAADILLSNEEFQQALAELSAIIQDAFGPIIHEMIPILQQIGRVLKAISPAIKKMAPFIEPLAKAIEHQTDVLIKITDTLEGVDEGLDSLQEVLESITEPLASLGGSLGSLESSVDALVSPLKKLARVIESFNPFGGGSGGGFSFAGVGFSDGGVVPGVGSGDIVPAMLEPGELVVPKDLTNSLLNISPGFGNIQTPANNQSSGSSGESEKRIIVDVVISPDEMTDFISAKQREQIALGVSKQ